MSIYTKTIARALFLAVLVVGSVVLNTKPAQATSPCVQACETAAQACEKECAGTIRCLDACIANFNFCVSRCN